VRRALGVEAAGDDRSLADAGSPKSSASRPRSASSGRLSAFGISSNALPGMAAAAMTVQRLLTRNLREVTEADALAIYEAAL
jgi:alcohol dehydrogenase class IV